MSGMSLSKECCWGRGAPPGAAAGGGGGVAACCWCQRKGDHPERGPDAGYERGISHAAFISSATKPNWPH